MMRSGRNRTLTLTSEEDHERSDMKTPEQIAETLVRGDLLGFILPDEGEIRIPYVKSVIAKAIREAREEASMAVLCPHCKRHLTNVTK